MDAGSKLRNSSWRRMPHCDVLFLSSEANNAEIRRGLPYDPILQPIREHLKNKLYRVENLYIPYASRPLPDLENCQYTIDRDFFLANQIGKRVKFANRRSLIVGMYRRLLERKVGRGIVGCNLPSELCQAAHELKLPAIEVNHGIGVDFAGYDYWRDFAPSHFLFFDSLSMSSFLRSGYQGITQACSYSLSFSRYWHAAPESCEHCTFLQERSNSFPIRVLITLGWFGEPVSVADHFLDLLQFPFDRRLSLTPQDFPLRSDLLETLKSTKDDVFWMLRLHPITRSWRSFSLLKKSIEALESSNVSVFDASVVPLDFALEVATHHVTESSSSVYRAEAHPVPSALVSTRLKFLDEKEASWPRKVAQELDLPIYSFLDEGFWSFIQDSRRRPARDFYFKGPNVASASQVVLEILETSNKVPINLPAVVS